MCPATGRRKMNPRRSRAAPTNRVETVERSGGEGAAVPCWEERRSGEQVTCDSNEKSCMNRDCDSCRMKIEAYDPSIVVPDLVNTTIKVHQWQNVEGLTKKEILGMNLISLFELLKEQLKPFLIHTYIKRVQSKHFESLKGEVNSKKVVLQDLKNCYPDIEEVHIFSDGVSSQSKQRFLFSNLILFEKFNNIKLTWNYFATSHGKGTVDGIGGAVKGSVWRRILAREILVNTAEEFVSVARQCNEKVNIKFVSMEQINEYFELLEERWQNIIPVPGTHRIHYVKPINENKIMVSDESVGIQRNERIVVLSEHFEEEDSDLNSTVKVGSFVKVKLSSKHREQFFIAQITNVKHDDVAYEVRYLKKTDNEKIFIDDGTEQYHIDYSDIIQLLEVPTIDNRGRYHFKNSILVS
ncbi:hypothetical protein JTE90_009311 [Oedothorax gibbosus]|uniref:Uncharacterized protein n=1 Tax=Oedothorax gibbosus TaxID=931172 RepID=A0AAV6TGW1_9ARAC|nr:hypothetical protein JTE90_009311 [Oedothorax gibbosus]